MKVVLVCVLVMVGVFVVKGAHEVCSLSDDQITAVAKCMGEKVGSELQGKAREVIRSQGGNVAELLRKQCDADIDFAEALKALVSPEQAEAVRKAYRDCRALQS